MKPPREIRLLLALMLICRLHVVKCAYFRRSRCANTYYIQEYHVHGEDDSYATIDDSSDYKDTAYNNGSGVDNDGMMTENTESALRARNDLAERSRTNTTRWTERVYSLQQQLIKEKDKHNQDVNKLITTIERLINATDNEKRDNQNITVVVKNDCVRTVEEDQFNVPMDVPNTETPPFFARESRARMVSVEGSGDIREEMLMQKINELIDTAIQRLENQTLNLANMVHSAVEQLRQDTERALANAKERNDKTVETIRQQMSGETAMLHTVIHNMEVEVKAEKAKNQDMQKSNRRLLSAHRRVLRDLNVTLENQKHIEESCKTNMQLLHARVDNATSTLESNILYLHLQMLCSQEEHMDAEICLQDREEMMESPPAMLRDALFDVMPRGISTNIKELNLVEVDSGTKPTKPGKPKPTRPKEKRVEARKGTVKTTTRKKMSKSTPRPKVDDEDTTPVLLENVSKADLEMTMSSLKDVLISAGKAVTLWAIEENLQTRPQDCSEIDLWAQRRQPVQTIYLRNRTRAVTVYCDDGWTVIQRNHYRGYAGGPNKWVQYKYGFGSLDDNDRPELFWMGNDYIYDLTQQDEYRLHIQLDSPEVTAEYGHFRIQSEANWYRLEVSHHRGGVGDIMGVFSSIPLLDHPFSTPDFAINAEYGTMAMRNGDGWWYPFKNPKTEMFTSSTTETSVFTGNARTRTGDKCFTNLNSYSPYFCSRNGEKVYVERVVMKVRPLGS